MNKNIGLGLVLSFVIIILYYLFSTVFIYTIGDEYILTPTVTTLNQTAQALNLDANSRGVIDNILPNYRATSIPYDLGFLVLLLMFIGGSVFAAIKSEKMGVFSFYGLLTLGLIFFLFLIGFIEIISDWFYNNLILGFLEFNIEVQAPLLNGFITNLGIYTFIWALSLILINRLGFKFTGKRETGGFEE